jgi:hypothetical protein
MQGLLAQDQQPQGGSPQSAAPAPQDDSRYEASDQDGQQASPEEQAQYEQAMVNAQKLLYTPDNQPQPGILDALKASQEEQPGDAQGKSLSPPVSALSHVAVMVVSKLDDSAREAGKPLTDDVLQEVGDDVIGMLADIANATGIHDYTEQELEGATVASYDMYRDKAIADGRTSEDDLKQQWDGLLQADKEGRLGDYGIKQNNGG